MLTELRIENFAIIDQLALQFGPGLVIFTGETGAGKSIIIDAVETLLGVRADSSVIRAGDDHSLVEGSFRIGDAVRPAVHAVLEREEMLDDPDYVTLSREFRREGRNVVRVNGRTASLALLKELGELLIDLHGQSEHLSLLRVPSHLGLLDRFAEVGPVHADYLKTYRELQSVRKELQTLRQAEKDAAKRAELLSFQVEEIEMAALVPGEEEELKEERTRLANAETLATQANVALMALDNSDDPESSSAISSLGAALEALEDLAKIDAAQADLHARIQELFDGAAELSRDVNGYLDSVEFNAARLEEVEERLDLINKLKRKYGETIEAIIAHGKRYAKELDDITHAEERILELEGKEGKLLETLAQKALALSARRKEAAEQLSAGIEQELKDLRMEQAQFAVDFRTKPDPRGLQLPDGERVAFDNTGMELVEFMVAPNPGEGLKPLVKIASGGETARLMLALKNVLAKADNTPTLIFDEIDQGIGGRVGAVVGQKLWNLGRNHQVLCITHLAQLAGFGQTHYKVDKSIVDGRTTTTIKALEGEDRLMELAQMMGEISAGTLQSATEIMQMVNQSTVVR